MPPNSKTPPTTDELVRELVSAETSTLVLLAALWPASSPADMLRDLGLSAALTLATAEVTRLRADVLAYEHRAAVRGDAPLTVPEADRDAEVSP